MVAFTRNADPLAAIKARIAGGIEQLGETIAANARERAPIGKDDTSKGEAIVLKGERSLKTTFVTRRIGNRTEHAEFSISAQKRLRTQFAKEGTGLESIAFRRLQANRHPSLSSRDIEKAAASVFRFKSGGGTPARVSVDKGGFLRGFRQHGALRKSIRFEGVKVDGNHVTGRIVAKVPYARRIEFGWHSETPTGGTYSVAAQPYLLPALQQEREALATGRPFKG